MKHRIFVAIDIPEELKNVAEAHIEPFYKNKLARVVERKNWHITVVFCGYLDDEKLNRLKELARKIAKEIKKFELIPDKIIFAPPHKKPRMLWLTFKQSREFSELQKALSEFSQGNKNSFPHLTLVRFQIFHFHEVKNFLPQEGISLKDAGAFTAESINIMESHLNRHGPSYELLEKIELS